MKITQDIRDYSEQEELKKGMEEKSKEFLEVGGEVYV
jgi:phosphomethylpyrimidine synthase